MVTLRGLSAMALSREAARGRRSHRGGRQVAADGAEPAWRRVQRARHREHPEVRGAGARLALTAANRSMSRFNPEGFACVPPRGRPARLSAFRSRNSAAV